VVVCLDRLWRRGLAWQLQEAKQRFSEVVRRALTEGPQWVTRHGRRVVVVVAADEYEASGRGASFKEFLLSAPDLDVLEIRRPGEPAPEVTL
jgi:prevent-host-death family protein